MRVNNALVANGFSVGTTSGFLSSAFWIQDVIRASFQFTVSSGSVNGAFIIQASNDQAFGANPNQFQPTNWNSLGSVTVVCSNTTQGQGTFLIQAVDLGYEYGRVSFTPGNNGAAPGLVNVRMKVIGV
jgi:hypothetical protein